MTLIDYYKVILIRIYAYPRFICSKNDIIKPRLDGTSIFTVWYSRRRRTPETPLGGRLSDRQIGEVLSAIDQLLKQRGQELLAAANLALSAKRAEEVVADLMRAGETAAAASQAVPPAS